MQIQVHTDHNIALHEPLSEHVKNLVEGAMSRFERRITRVEVHLGDENGHRGGRRDKRCTMEARLSGHEPTVVTHHALSVDEALSGAAHKLIAAVQHVVDRSDPHHNRH